MTDLEYWGRSSRRVSRRRALHYGLGASLAAGFFLAGCGDDETPSTSSPTAAGTTSPSGTGTPAAQKPTGKVTISVSGLGNQNYDPAKASGLAEEFANAHFGEALVIMGPEKNTYIGGVAESWEATTEDGLTWAFTIREGVTAHDGSTLTPEDVAYTVERWIDPANEPVSGATMQRILDRLEVVGNQVIFHLKEPHPFIVHLAYMQITPRAAVEAAGAAAFAKNPISAGPFRFVSARPDQGVTLEAFEQHYRKVPTFKDLELLLVPEVTTRLASLKAGESDVMLKPSGPAIADLESGGNTRLHEAPSTSANDICFLDMAAPESNTTSPWADPRMRLAVAHAVDVDTMIERIFFKRGIRVAIPAAVPGLPGVPDLTPRAYDPKRARELISAAGHEGMEFPIYTYESGAQAGNPDSAQAVSTYLNAVGFKTQANQLEYASLFENLRGKTWAGTGALSVQVVAARAAESFLGVVDPDSAAPNFYSPELAAEAKRLFQVSGEELLQKTSDLAQKFYDEIVRVPLVSANYVQGYGPRIKSWEPRMRAGYELGMEYIELA